MIAPLCTFAKAFTGRRLLGAALGDQATWQTWRAVLKAAYAEPLDAAERAAFDTVAGGRQPPTRKVKEFVVAASRRAGKGRAAGALATYASALMDHTAVLAPGEVGVVAAVSPTRAQAEIVKNYTCGYFERSPVLRDEIVEVTAEEIRLRNGNVITTLASDFRTLRGRTLLLAILDEASFLRDETSATPDIEAARALLPGLSTTGGMLCILSSPYRRAGLLYSLHRDFFGRDSDEVLCVAGPSLAFNPTLDVKAIEAASAHDPQAAVSEWFGEFRSDLAQFLDDADIDAAVDHGRPSELPPRENTRHYCFVDMGGGRADASTLCVGFRDRDKFVAALVRGKHGDPHAAVTEFAALAKQYHCSTIVGDAYSAEWCAASYRAAGLEYRQSALTRSELYLEGLTWFTRGLITIPNNPTLLRELRQLERRTARSGKDAVNHPTGSGYHDDHANALFGAMYLCAKAAQRSTPKFVAPVVVSRPCSIPGGSAFAGESLSVSPNSPHRPSSTEDWYRYAREW